MFDGIGLETLLAINRPINLLGRHRTFFRNSVGDDRRRCPMEEVQDPKLHVLKAEAKLIDPVPQVVRLGAAQLMPQLAQPFQPEKALRLRPDRQPAVPVEKRTGAICLPVQDDGSLRHSPSSLFANVRYGNNR